MNNALYKLFGVLPFLGFCTAAILAWYFYLKARNKERMALIEKGADLSKFYTTPTRIFFPWMSLGIVITGITIGVLVDFVLFLLFQENDSIAELAAPGLIVFGALFGGLSMILAHKINMRQK